MSSSYGPLGNVISRLQGLKNVSGRKVMPGAEFIQNLDDTEPSMEGAAAPMPKFSNFNPPYKNEPEADLGGELTPQSYDVRANSVNNSPSKASEEPGFFSRLGDSLSKFKSYVETPGSLGHLIGDYVNPFQSGAGALTNYLGNESPEEDKNIPVISDIKNAVTQPYQGVTPSSAVRSGIDWLKENFTPEVSAETYNQIAGLKKPEAMVQQQATTQAVDQAKIDEARMNPMQVVAYGATDAFANRPELVSQFQEYSGINFNQQEKDLTEKYEKVLADIESGNEANSASYDEQEARIKQRILNNESNEADKYYVGLALLMPLLIGGLFGKEAGIGALSGGAKGIANVMGQRQKDIRSDEESLADIYKQRAFNDAKKGELEIEKLKIPGEIRKNLPKDEYQDLKGLNIHTFRDPQTGEVVGEGAEVLPDLYMDLKYGNTEKSRDAMRKEAGELEKEKSSLERANVATSNVIKAAMQMEDNGLFGQIIALGLSDNPDTAARKLIKQNSPKIMVDGRMQNAADYLDGQLELLKDAYRRNEQMKAFTQTVANHVGQMATNPIYTGLEPQDLINQVLNLRERAQGLFVDRAAGQGFLREPLENKFGKVNRELYQGLNQKEDNKEILRDKQLMQSSR